MKLHQCLIDEYGEDAPDVEALRKAILSAQEDIQRCLSDLRKEIGGTCKTCKFRTPAGVCMNKEAMYDTEVSDDFFCAKYEE
jgi:hypothetical protein